jgi:hypothetical protein
LSHRVKGSFVKVQFFLWLSIMVPSVLSAQIDSTIPDRAIHVHHNPVRPNYVDEIPAPKLDPIRIPPPPVGDPPPYVRGIYMNAWTFGGSRLANLIALADTTEINAFVIDVKEVDGYISYRSSVPTAIQVGANGRIAVRNVRERLALLHEKGIHTIARIVVAKDALLAAGKPDWAIQHVDGGEWVDRFDSPWVDAYRDSVWIYAADLAQEAVLLGFDEIQLDYVRFPDEPVESMETAFFPGRIGNESRRNGIRRNLQIARNRLRPLGVPFTLDVFGLTTSALGDMGIGQVWEDLSEVSDVLLPMVYPSHYNAGAYGFSFPNGEPYGIVHAALQDAVERSEGIENAARIRPYLQSFSIRRAVYRAPEIRAQIKAVYDLGLTDWVLWNASGRYPADAFEPAAPAEPGATPGNSGRN